MCVSPSDPFLTDLDRILREGQDPGAQQYLVLCTVPIKGKNLEFWVPIKKKTSSGKTLKGSSTKKISIA